MIGLRVDIFEDQSQTPIVTHIFWGKDRTEALAVLEAHQKTDQFLDAAETTKRFRGMILSTITYWVNP